MLSPRSTQLIQNLDTSRKAALLASAFDALKLDFTNVEVMRNVADILNQIGQLRVEEKNIQKK